MSNHEQQHRESESDEQSAGVPEHDAVATVRRHPEWFFRERAFDTEEALALLLTEALRGGATRVAVRREGEWASVEADEDWLHSDVAAFFSPESYPEGGRNSSRVEVALTAFCRAVVTSTPDGLYEVRSTPGLREETGDLLTWTVSRGRLVAFLPPENLTGRRQGKPSRATLRREGLRLIQGEGEEVVLSAVRSFVSKRLDVDG